MSDHENLASRNERIRDLQEAVHARDTRINRLLDDNVRLVGEVEKLRTELEQLDQDTTAVDARAYKRGRSSAAAQFAALATEIQDDEL